MRLLGEGWRGLGRGTVRRIQPDTLCLRLDWVIRPGLRLQARRLRGRG